MNILKTIYLAWIILWLGIPAYAQEETKEFRRDYNYFTTYDIDTQAWSEWKEMSNTFVFNAFSNNDIVIYWGSGEKEVYRRVSSITNGTNNKGQKYQALTILSEKGSELYLLLYDEDGFLVLVDKWGSKVQFQK